MTDTFNIGDVLRAVAGAMHYPVIILLILFLLAALALLGWLLAEYFTERRHMNVALPALLEAMQHTDDLNACIEQSGLLRRQKDALIELAAHPDFSPELREAPDHLAHPHGHRRHGCDQRRRKRHRRKSCLRGV